MTDYFDGPLLGFDIESTGVDQWDDRVVQFAMVYSAYRGANPEVLSWLIDPGVEIAEGATAVHGISTAYAQEFGKQAHNAMPFIARRMEKIVELGIPFVIYNAPFDTTMIYNEFERYNVQLRYTREEMFEKVIDPLVIDKAVDKYRKGSRKLIDTAAHYGHTLVGAHEATADIFATLHVARALKPKFPEEMTIEMLQEFQKDAKIEQSTSFQKYLRKKTDEEGNLIAPDAVISTEWPFQTTKETN